MTDVTQLIKQENGEVSNYKIDQTIICNLNFLPYVYRLNFEPVDQSLIALSETYAKPLIFYPYLEDVIYSKRIKQLISQRHKVADFTSVDPYSEDNAEVQYLTSTPVSFIILGKPEIGEKELARHLSNYWKCVYISPESIINEEISSGSRAGKCIEFNLKAGYVIDPEIILRLVEKRVNSQTAKHRGYVISGFPILSNDQKHAMSSESATFTAQEIVDELLPMENFKVSIVKKSAPFVTFDKNIIDIGDELKHGKYKRMTSIGDEKDNLENNLDLGSSDDNILYHTKSSCLLNNPENQLEFIFNLCNDQLVIIYIMCSNLDVIRFREKSKSEQDVSESITRSETASSPDVTLNIEMNKVEVSSNIQENNEFRTTTSRTNITSQIRQFIFHVQPVIEKKILDHDPQNFIKVDGRMLPEKMFHAVRTRLKTLAFQPVLIPKKLADKQISGNFGRKEIVSKFSEMTLQECYNILRSNQTVGSIYKWQLSNWCFKCPVAFKEGKIQTGNPDLAVKFMNKIFFLSSEEALLKFYRNPRPYLIPISLIPTGRFWVIGPKLAGKTVVARCLSILFDCKILDPNELEDIYKRKKKLEYVEKLRAEAVTKAFEVFHEKLKREREERIDEWKKQAVALLNEVCNYYSFSQIEQNISALNDDNYISRNENELRSLLVDLNLPSFSEISLIKSLSNDLDKILDYLPHELTGEIEYPDAIDPFVTNFIKDTLRNASIPEINLTMDEKVNIFKSAVDDIEYKYFEKYNRRGGWIIDNMPPNVEFLKSLESEYMADDIICLRDADFENRFLLEKFSKQDFSSFRDYKSFFIKMGKMAASETMHSFNSSISRLRTVNFLTGDVDKVGNMNLKMNDEMIDNEKNLAFANTLYRFNEDWIETKEYLTNILKKSPIEINIAYKSFYDLLKECVITLEDKYRRTATVLTDDERIQELKDFQELRRDIFLTKYSNDDNLTDEDEEKSDDEEESLEDDEEMWIGKKTLFFEEEETSAHMEDLMGEHYEFIDKYKELLGEQAVMPNTDHETTSAVVEPGVKEESTDEEAATEEDKPSDEDVSDEDKPTSIEGELEDEEEEETDKREELKGEEEILTSKDIFFRENRRLGNTADYCPIAFYRYNVLWKGKEELTVQYKDKIYLLSSQVALKKFILNPGNILTKESPDMFPPPRICVAGVAGSGKTTLAKNIARNFGLCYINFDSLLLHSLNLKEYHNIEELLQWNPNVHENEEVSLEDLEILSNYWEKDQTLPNDKIKYVLSPLWFSLPYANSGFVLDNFPHSSCDVSAMTLHYLIPDVVIYLNITQEEVYRRNFSIKFDQWWKDIQERKRLKHLDNEEIFNKWQENRFALLSLLASEKYEERKAAKINEISQQKRILTTPVDSKMSLGRIETAAEELDIFGEELFYYDPTDEREDLDEINKLLEEELPEPKFDDQWESDEQAIDRINYLMNSCYIRDTEYLENMSYLLKQENIDCIRIDAEAKTPVKILNEVTILTENLKFRSKSLFERVYEIPLHVAEKLLEEGYYFMSKFGRNCPVQVFDKIIPMQMFLPAKLHMKVFTVTYRRYIYFLIGEESRDKFKNDPIKYACNKDYKLPMIPIRIAIIGPPKSGKTSLAARFKKEFHLKVISRAKAIRYIRKRVPFCELAQNIKDVLRNGWVVTNEMAAKSVEAVTLNSMSISQGYVLDGYPNSLEEMRHLIALGIIPHVILYIQASGEKILECVDSDPDQKYKYKTWKKSAHKLREWLRKEYDNVYLIQNLNSKWHMWEQAKDVTLSVWKQFQIYLRNKDYEKALIMKSLCVPPLEILEKQSVFKNYCPLCFYCNDILNFCGKYPDRNCIVQFKESLFYICKQHLNMFLREPTKYVPPENTKLLPEDLPTLSQNVLQPAYQDGLCIVSFWDNQPNRVLTQGIIKFSSFYKGNYYLFCSEQCLLKFMKTPLEYFDKIIHFREANPLQLCDMRKLPTLGYLEQYVAKLVIDAVLNTEILRPFHPGLTIAHSALMHIALFLKCKNPKISKDILPIYEDATQVFYDRQNKFKDALNYFKYRTNPFLCLDNYKMKSEIDKSYDSFNEDGKIISDKILTNSTKTSAESLFNLADMIFDNISFRSSNSGTK